MAAVQGSCQKAPNTWTSHHKSCGASLLRVLWVLIESLICFRVAHLMHALNNQQAICMQPTVKQLLFPQPRWCAAQQQPGHVYHAACSITAPGSAHDLLKHWLEHKPHNGTQAAPALLSIPAWQRHEHAGSNQSTTLVDWKLPPAASPPTKLTSWGEGMQEAAAQYNAATAENITTVAAPQQPPFDTAEMSQEGALASNITTGAAMDGEDSQLAAASLGLQPQPREEQAAGLERQQQQAAVQEVEIVQAPSPAGEVQQQAKQQQADETMTTVSEPAPAAVNTEEAAATSDLTVAPAMHSALSNMSAMLHTQADTSGTPDPSSSSGTAEQQSSIAEAAITQATTQAPAAQQLAAAQGLGAESQAAAEPEPFIAAEAVAVPTCTDTQETAAAVPEPVIAPAAGAVPTPMDTQETVAVPEPLVAAEAGAVPTPTDTQETAAVPEPVIAAAAGAVPTPADTQETAAVPEPVIAAAAGAVPTTTDTQETAAVSEPVIAAEAPVPDAVLTVHEMQVTAAELEPLIAADVQQAAAVPRPCEATAVPEPVIVAEAPVATAMPRPSQVTAVPELLNAAEAPVAAAVPTPSDAQEAAAVPEPAIAAEAPTTDAVVQEDMVPGQPATAEHDDMVEGSIEQAPAAKAPAVLPSHDTSVQPTQEAETIEEQQLEPEKEAVSHTVSSDAGTSSHESSQLYGDSSSNQQATAAPAPPKSWIGHAVIPFLLGVCSMLLMVVAVSVVRSHYQRRHVPAIDLHALLAVQQQPAAAEWASLQSPVASPVPHYNHARQVQADAAACRGSPAPSTSFLNRLAETQEEEVEATDTMPSPIAELVSKVNSITGGMRILRPRARAPAPPADYMAPTESEIVRRSSRLARAATSQETQQEDSQGVSSISQLVRGRGRASRSQQVQHHDDEDDAPPSTRKAAAPRAHRGSKAASLVHQEEEAASDEVQSSQVQPTPRKSSRSRKQ